MINRGSNKTRIGAEKRSAADRPTQFIRRLLLCMSACYLIAAATFAEEKPRATVWPSPDWPTVDPAGAGFDVAQLHAARDYALSAGGSGLILHRGNVVLRWGDQRRRYDIKSASKSFGATALGVAVGDGRIDLNAPARKYHPTLGIPPKSNAATGWLDDITILQLATQTAGFAKPGGYEKLLFKPGTH